MLRAAAVIDNTPEAEEDEVLTEYTIRLNYSDGTYDTVTVQATSRADAIRKAQAETSE